MISFAMIQLAVLFCGPLVVSCFTLFTIDETENRVKAVIVTNEKTPFFTPLSFNLFYFNTSYIMLTRWNSDSTFLSGVLAGKEHGSFLQHENLKVLASKYQGYDKCCSPNHEAFGLYHNETYVIVKGTDSKHLFFRNGIFRNAYLFSTLKTIRFDPITGNVHALTTR
jgi:hypothetical protein